MNEKKILYVHRDPFTSFIRKDFELLIKKFDMRRIRARPRTLIIKLLMNVPKVDLVFIWFAGWHAFLSVLLAKVFRKKSIVVVGGYDAARVPEINYGVFTSWWRGRLAKWVYKNVDKILVVDESLKHMILKYTKLKISKKIVTLPTGHSCKMFKPGGGKEKIVLTVTSGKKKDRFFIKGIDTFLETAKLFPNIIFVVVGLEGECKKLAEKYKNPNVQLVGFLKQRKLLKFYQRAKVYCQLSRHEGLPTVLCEAMLCECIPIGTKVNGIVTVIKNVGFLIDRNPKEIGGTIKKALNVREDLGKKARGRIIKLFSIDKRRKGLLEQIEKLTVFK